MKFRYLLILLLGILMSACDISENEIEPSATFTKIYDDSRFSEFHTPVDVIQAADSGYLVLVDRKIDGQIFSGIGILKTDDAGAILQFNEVGNDLVYPVNSWLVLNGQLHFVAMSSNTLQAQLVAVDNDGNIGTITPLNGLTYPMVAAADGAGFLLQSYNSVDKKTVISSISASGQLQSLVEFDIGAGENIEVPIIDHFTKNGPHLPFQIGRTGNLVYFNGFYNYTLSLVFTDLSDDTPNGVCQGQQNNGGISGVSALGQNLFAISRFNFGDNYLTPMASIPTNGIMSSVDIPGNTFPELVKDAAVSISQDPVTNTLIYASTTKSSRIILLGFDASTGELKGTKYLGNLNPFEAGSMSFTGDGGLILAGRTDLEGRFSRIVLFKLDPLALQELTQ